MKETWERLSRIFFQFSASSSSIVSRRIWSPRPALSFPARSTITTSPDFRSSTCIQGTLTREGRAKASALHRALEGLHVALDGDAPTRLLHVGAEHRLLAL